MSDAKLEAHYAFLDALPRSLFPRTVRHVHGELEPRARSVCALRTALLDGELPERSTLRWPRAELRDALFGALEASGVPEVCQADPELTDEVVLYVLDSVHEAHRLYERGVVAFSQIAARERVRSGGLCLGGERPGAPGGRPSWRVIFGEHEWETLRREAMQLAADMASEMLRTQTDAVWVERVDLLKELGVHLRELCASLGLPPGAERGLLRGLGRNELLRLRTVLSELEPLGDLVRRLGRAKPTNDPDAPTVLERIGALVRRQRESSVPELDRGPIDVRGIERSGELARMLPSEAALLTHPVLRKLWHARWLERSLLTYHAQGVLTQRIQTEQTFETGIAEENERLERGPIIVILDTSGSMWGTRDRVAKSVALQIASVAFMEERPCYAYNFSGNGDLVEHQLAFDGDGITEMLAFLTLSFGGGTQPDEALRRAMNRLETCEWRLADVVILSDGEFYVGSHIQRRLAAIRERSDVRVHGLRTGSGDGFDLVPCDEVHDLGDWLSMLDVPLR